MKKYLLLLVLAASMFACGNKSAQQGATGNTESNEKAGTEALTLDKLLVNADDYVDKPVVVTGYVTHTCKHSGKRCFLADEDQTVSVRVEAKGKIGGFNRELIGSQIQVSGIFHEKRTTTEEIDLMEKMIEEKSIKDDGSAESCDAETANVQKMREWMKKHNKDYYVKYYIDGEDFEEIQ